jgi:predicted nuclease of restriction endonuclease-like (RecB) superfamily
MTKNKQVISNSKAYKKLLQDILQEIESHRVKAARELNFTHMQLYYKIGSLIVKRQEKEGWGKSIVENLAKDLRITGSKQGYSIQNLWFMRQFYLEYTEKENLQRLAFQVPWGQNILLLSKVKDEKQRKFYLAKTIEAAWSRKTLLNMV